MGLPLVSAITGDQAIWRPVGALLLLLGVVLRAGPTLPEEQSGGFSATVKVDATADSVAAARELARVVMVGVVTVTGEGAAHRAEATDRRGDIRLHSRGNAQSQHCAQPCFEATMHIDSPHTRLFVEAFPF